MKERKRGYAGERMAGGYFPDPIFILQRMATTSCAALRVPVAALSPCIV